MILAGGHSSTTSDSKDDRRPRLPIDIQYHGQGPVEVTSMRTTTTRRNGGMSKKAHAPTIACFNKATVSLGVDFDALIAAMQAFVDEHVAPVWGTRAKLIGPRASFQANGRWFFSTMPIMPIPLPITI